MSSSVSGSPSSTGFIIGTDLSEAFTRSPEWYETQRQYLVNTIAQGPLTIWSEWWGSHDALYYLIFVYAASQPLLNNLCRRKDGNGLTFYERNRDSLKKVMACYNICMSLFSFWCSVVCFWALKGSVEERGAVFTNGHFKEKTGWYGN
jgi:hypothetical protein